MRLRPDLILQQITGLLLDYPELADDDVLRADMLEAETDLTEFLRRLERDRQDTAAHEMALDEQIKALKARQYKFGRRQEAMRALALKLLYAADIPKTEMPEATYSIRMVPPSVIITDETKLPDSLCRFTRTPDKTKIKEALQDGPIPGATMSNGGRTLSIRIK